MPLERLRLASKKTIGTKQTTKALEKGILKVVYIAKDAEPHVTRDLEAMCREKGVELIYVDTMALLGKACNIEVGAASAGIIEG